MSETNDERNNEQYERNAMATLYTRDQILEKDGKDGRRLWIVVKKCVYDVTDYVEEHPGSPELIRDHAGKDATKDFDLALHSSDAKKLLETFKVGEVDDSMEKKDNKGPANTNEIRRSYLSVITCGLIG